MSMTCERPGWAIVPVVPNIDVPVLHAFELDQSRAEREFAALGGYPKRLRSELSVVPAVVRFEFPEK